MKREVERRGGGAGVGGGGYFPAGSFALVAIRLEVKEHERMAGRTHICAYMCPEAGESLRCVFSGGIQEHGKRENRLVFRCVERRGIYSAR